MLKYLFFTVFLLLCIQANATHMAGGEITYTHITGNTYEFNLKLYRDCGGTAPPNYILLNFYSLSQMQNFNVSISQDTIFDYSSFCPNILTTCSGLGIQTGHQICIYKGVVTLPVAANDWIISTKICCRNNSIDNLQAPGANNIGIWSTLNNTLATSWNNSSKFVLESGLIFNVGQTYTINQTAIDIDGDSLNYSLVQPINSVDSGVFMYINFMVPYTYLNPIPGNISINQQNGDITFNSTLQGEFVVDIKVDEYRNGVLVGSVVRDLQLIFIYGSPNALPTLSGINGGNTNFIVHKVCPGSSINFTINSYDSDINDSIKVNFNTINIPNATISVSNTAQPVITFDWTPTLADIRPQPYLFCLQARDNHCNLNGIQNFGYLIYVTHCNTDTVWPGDANSDYVVNNYDILNIGLAYNTNGIIRPNANNSWTPQYCTAWPDSFINGINYKHADCDGNGIIDNSDINVVSLNYGNFHLKTYQEGKYKSRGLPDLFFESSGILAMPGNTIQVPIHLGVSNTPMNNIYGIAGKILVSGPLSNYISLDNNVSWIGSNQNSILFQKNINSYNNIDFTIVKNNHQSSSGYGEISSLSIPISANAVLGDKLILNFVELKFINNEGHPITDYNVLSDTIIIGTLSSLNNTYQQPEINVSPNPFNEELVIDINNFNSSNEMLLQMYDITGNLLLKKKINSSNTKLNLKNISTGVYFIRILEDEKTIFHTKVTK